MKKLFTLIFLAISSLVSATTYYVSTSGSNSNNGLTTTTPWQTLAWAETHATSPGDVIALKKGDDWSSATALGIQHGGAVGSPIIWDGSLWGTGANAVISANGKHNDPSGSTGGAAIVCVTGCKNVTFQNITLNGNKFYCYGFVVGGDPSMAPNAHQNDEQYITLQDCNIIDIGGGSDYCMGVLIRTWFNAMANITIQRNVVNGTASWGIAGYMGKRLDGAPGNYECRDLYIGYNTVTNNETAHRDMGAAIGISLWVTRAIIEHNIVTQGANGNAVAGIGISGYEGVFPTGTIIRYNDIRMVNQPAFITENGYAIQADIYYNLFYTSAATATVWLFPPSVYSYAGGALNFYNNTIVCNKGDAFYNEIPSAGTVKFVNNVVVNTVAKGQSCYVSLTSAACVHNHNSFYRSGAGDLLYAVDGGAYKYRSTAQAWEPTAKIIDPMFIDLNGADFHLQAGSPIIGQGISIAGLSADMDGKSLSAPPTMGCYEAPGLKRKK
jgi:hypothetical protein